MSYNLPPGVTQRDIDPDKKCPNCQSTKVFENSAPAIAEEDIVELCWIECSDCGYIWNKHEI